MSSLTKQALSHALKNLLLEKPLNRITVGDIATECGVNRQTFYYHFRDVPDLVGWTMAQDAKNTFLTFKNKDFSWEEGFSALFDLMLEDKRFILNIYHSVSLEVLTEYIYKLCYPSIKKAVDNSPSSSLMNDSERKFAADFYKYALTGIILNWIKGDMREDPKRIVAMTIRMFEKGVRPQLIADFNDYENL